MVPTPRDGALMVQDLDWLREKVFFLALCPMKSFHRIANIVVNIVELLFLLLPWREGSHNSHVSLKLE